MYEDILTIDEHYSLKLRTLYHSYGYRHKRLSRFESYDFYAGKKDFLTISPRIFTFTDTDGKLMALRPDITLSLVSRVDRGKWYYDETVYRANENSGKCAEIRQIGIECIGMTDNKRLAEIIMIALMSLQTLSGSRDYALDVGDAGTISRLLPENDVGAEILKCIQDKNIHRLKELGASYDIIRLIEAPCLDDLGIECASAVRNVNDSHMSIDFSAVSNLKYYNGIVLKGYIDGIPKAVLSGGQYDIAGKYGAGFAVYIDSIGGVIGDKYSTAQR